MWMCILCVIYNSEKSITKMLDGAEMVVNIHLQRKVLDIKNQACCGCQSQTVKLKYIEKKGILNY